MLQKIPHNKEKIRKESSKKRKSSDILNIVQIKPGIKVQKDNSKDSLITDFGKATLKDRYLLPDEDFQGMFARVASYFADMVNMHKDYMITWPITGLCHQLQSFPMGEQIGVYQYPVF